MRAQVPHLAVHRDRVLRTHQRVDQLDLLLAGVAGHVSVLEDDLGPDLGEVVDHVGDGFFISRDRMR